MWFPEQQKEQSEAKQPKAYENPLKCKCGGIFIPRKVFIESSEVCEKLQCPECSEIKWFEKTGQAGLITGSAPGVYIYRAGKHGKMFHDFNLNNFTLPKELTHSSVGEFLPLKKKNNADRLLALILKNPKCHEFRLEDFN